MRRLGVSNLAWAPEAEQDAFRLLAATGAEGIEVAPTRIAAWDALSPERLRRFRRDAAAAGLRVSSLQAVFFGRPEAALLGDEAGFAAMASHMEVLARIAEALDAGVAVFGAPRSRLRGDRPVEEAMELAAARLRRLGDIAAGGGLVLGLEPVPPVYGADFLLHARDMVALVERTAHPGVRAHLDTACVSLAGDDPAAEIARARPLLAHYHMAEPQLGPFDAPSCDHGAAGAALDRIGYDRWVVIEMKQSEGDGLAGIATAIDYARRHYMGGIAAA